MESERRFSVLFLLSPNASPTSMIFNTVLTTIKLSISQLKANKRQFTVINQLTYGVVRLAVKLASNKSVHN